MAILRIFSNINHYDYGKGMSVKKSGCIEMNIKSTSKQLNLNPKFELEGNA